MIAHAASRSAPETLEAPAPYAVSDAEFHRLLGYPPWAQPSERALELAVEARRWYAEHGRPWSYSREAQLAIDGEVVRIDDAVFRSPGLLRRFQGSGVDRVVLAAASAGAGCEAHAGQLWREGRPDEYFFLEMFGSAVVESLVAGLNGRICGWADGARRWALPHYSPGYGEWDVSEQAALLGCLEHGRTAVWPEPLNVLASGMLVPRKALLAVIGLTPRGPVAPAAGVPCVECSFAPCQYRRRPYRHAANPNQPVPLTAPPAYRIGERALRKWAAERVALDRRPDGSVRARFRFDGTTCSNLGQPLAFDYELDLAPPDTGRIVREALCRPALGDEGHRRMCAYLEDSDALMAAIAAESPRPGVPLDSALTAASPGAASGCHCTAEGRAHKWSMALQAIHFALQLSHDQTL